MLSIRLVDINSIMVEAKIVPIMEPRRMIFIHSISLETIWIDGVCWGNTGQPITVIVEKCAIYTGTSPACQCYEQCA